MRSASYGLIGLAIIVGILGLVNHVALKLNPVAHTSIILGGVAVVLLVIGGAMMLTGRSSSN